jgi:hypothetical protein
VRRGSSFAARVARSSAETVRPLQLLDDLAQRVVGHEIWGHYSIVCHVIGAVISCITREGHPSAMAGDRDRAGANAAQLAAIVLNLSVAS